MSEFIEVKTAELTGAALDYSVLLASGWQECRPWDGQLQRIAARGGMEYCLAGVQSDAYPSVKNAQNSPSTDWAQGGPLIDRYDVSLANAASSTGHWACVKISLRQPGPTRLIAACRAIVASVYGDTVSVPKELIA